MCAAALPKAGSTPKTIWHINPTGKFFIGGPRWRLRPHRPQDHRRHLRRRGPAWRRCVLRQGSDQGRPLGGLRGALSSPRTSSRPVSPTAARVQLAYAIGVASPLSIYVDTHGTGKVSEEQIEKAAAEAMRPAPARHPQASRSPTSRSTRAPRLTATSAATPDKDGGFSWEKTDIADAFKRAVSRPTRYTSTTDPGRCQGIAFRHRAQGLHARGA